MSDNGVEHRITKLETNATHIIKQLEEIKTDLQPIKKHVLTLNAVMKFSTSAVALLIIKKLLGI